jgi:hypothetical protein
MTLYTLFTSEFFFLKKKRFLYLHFLLIFYHEFLPRDEISDVLQLKYFSDYT